MESENITEKVLEYLKLNHTGKEMAVSRRFLEKKYKLSGRKLRNVINSLRCEGKPICSDENGYYYAENEKEVIGSIRQLNSRIGNIARAKNGLLKSLSLFTDSRGQRQLEFWFISEKRGGIHYK